MYRNFCADWQLYHRSINAEESQTGLPSTRPRNLDADQVLQTDAHARAEYIQRESREMCTGVTLISPDLQELRFLCVETIKGLVKSTVQLPYTVKMLARETLLALRVRKSLVYLIISTDE
jgi:Ras GTPase-activating-like protein IQGAP2/3